MSNNRYKLLIVEDERHITSLLGNLAQAEGFQVLTAGSCEEGLLMFASHRPDLIILDLGLPDEDGKVLIRRIRKEAAVPIIVLSARSDESEKVAALDLGANDYVTKPFGAAELMARVRAELRAGRFGSLGTAPSAVFCSGELEINFDSRKVLVSDEVVHLTQTEFNILAFMAANRGRVMTYTAIVRSIWGQTDSGSVK